MTNLMRIYLFIFAIIICNSSQAQLSNISFSINNFVHQKSSFKLLNEVDTKGAFLEPINTFGQHYFLIREKEINDKVALQYGLGLGYTRIGYRFKRSEEFLSIGQENNFIENRGGNTNTMFTVPVGLLYKLIDNNKSSIYFNLNLKTIFALRTGITFRSSVSNDNERKVVYIANTPINDENTLDFILGAGIDYRRQILEGQLWWKIGLNFNYALTNYYTGTATLFGDDENLDIEIENKLHHLGIEVGIIKSL